MSQPKKFAQLVGITAAPEGKNTQGVRVKHAHGPECKHDHDHDGPAEESHVHTEQSAGPVQLTGRTPCDRIVVFAGNPRQIGQLIDVAIYDASPFTLFGSVLTSHVGPQVFQMSL